MLNNCAPAGYMSITDRCNAKVLTDTPTTISKSSVKRYFIEIS